MDQQTIAVPINLVQALASYPAEKPNQEVMGLIAGLDQAARAQAAVVAPKDKSAADGDPAPSA